MNYFVSCDWGTTSFRIRLINNDDLRIIAEIVTDDGISSLYNRWINSKKGEDERFVFYHDFLRNQLSLLAQKHGSTLQDTAVVLSGMASSSVGMAELPYKQLPFLTDGSDLHVKVYNGNLLMVSGTRTNDDVLRGEETMLIGCAGGSETAEAVYIFPGTHSKHIFVKNGTAISFKTFMTGEMFDLLSNKSILSNSVRKPSGKLESAGKYFREGFKKGASGNLLNVCFTVRTNQLLKNVSAEDNYEYLSGLIIGAELKDSGKETPIVLVCNESQKNRYMQSLELLQEKNRVEHVEADRALIAGQKIILDRFKDQLR